MTFMIAAAGTGGHVYPGLAVGEALVDLGVPPEQVCYLGGDRLEAEVYPEHGFPFLQLTLRGLRRSLSPGNLAVPLIVLRAASRIREAMAQRGTRVALGMGGYVTIPAGLAAARSGVAFMLAEQNARAGLANRVARRWARRCFGSFPETGGLEGAEWVGNPVRRGFWSYDRDRLRPQAMERYRLDPGLPVLGAFGGSLGSAAINRAVARLAADWDGPPIQLVHLTGDRPGEAEPAGGSVTWRRMAFEDSMELFYAGCDLVLGRAGGAVAELIATATPSLLVPGEFGSRGHQRLNARFLVSAGAAVMVEEAELDSLPRLVMETLLDPGALAVMRSAGKRIARPDAARSVARAMMEAAR